jgi:hypothetical protein
MRTQTVLRSVLVLGLFAIAAHNAAAAATKKAPVSFAGIWTRNAPFTDPFRTVDAALYTPSYAAKNREALQAVKSGRFDIGASCMPSGVVRSGEVGPFEIVDAPDGRIIMIYEFMTQIRRVYMSGDWPEVVDPTVNGRSMGHWEGKTLVVETRGMSELTFLDRNAAPHSENMRVIERISLLNPDLMRFEVAVEDSDALTAPWKYTTDFKRMPPGAELIDYECNENPRNPINADGSVGFQVQQTVAARCSTRDMVFAIACMTPRNCAAAGQRQISLPDVKSHSSGAP